MFSRDFARGPTWPVHPTVDLALNFHKKIPLYSPSSLNISEGGSLLSFCTVIVRNNFTSVFGSLGKYHKVASSNTSCLEAHAGFFKLRTKGIFHPYVL